MIGDVVMSSMDTEPLDKGQDAFFKAKLEGNRGATKGRGMGPPLKPLDSGRPYGVRLTYGFALLRAGE